jgi:hypothetical protein
MCDWYGVTEKVGPEYNERFFSKHYQFGSISLHNKANSFLYDVLRMLVSRDIML